MHNLITMRQLDDCKRAATTATMVKPRQAVHGLPLEPPTSIKLLMQHDY